MSNEAVSQASLTISVSLERAIGFSREIWDLASLHIIPLPGLLDLTGDHHVTQTHSTLSLPLTLPHESSPNPAGRKDIQFDPQIAFLFNTAWTQ